MNYQGSCWCVGDCTLLTLLLGWFVRQQAKANVCNVRRQIIFYAVAFLKNLFSALAIRSDVSCCPMSAKNCLFKAVKFQVSTAAIPLQVTVKV